MTVKPHSAGTPPAAESAEASESLTGPSQPPLSCGKPKYLIVLLHDAGSVGEAVIELALEWAPTLNKGEFLAPDAPWHSDVPGAGRQWLGRSEPDVASGLEEAAERLHRFLEEALRKRRLKPGQLALLGFGQGAALALRAGLSAPEALGAIVAVGRGVSASLECLQPPRSASSILLVEADIDAGRGSVSMEDSECRLRGWGLPVRRVTHPGDYFGLDDSGLQAIAGFLREALAGKTDQAD